MRGARPLRDISVLYVSAGLSPRVQFCLASLARSPSPSLLRTRARMHSRTHVCGCSGEVRLQIFVSNELLAERRITVRSLSSWTKEDAAEWILTLGMIEPTIRSVSRELSQEFVNQNVTGAKIAGGLVSPCVPLMSISLSLSPSLSLWPYVRMFLSHSPPPSPLPSFLSVFTTRCFCYSDALLPPRLPHAFHPALIRP